MEPWIWNTSLSYSFPWVIPRRLNCVCRPFGTLCFLFIGRVNNLLRWKRVFRTAHKIQTPRNHSKERMQHSQHGENLKPTILIFYILLFSGALCLTAACVLCGVVLTAGKGEIFRVAIYSGVYEGHILWIWGVFENENILVWNVTTELKTGQKRDVTLYQLLLCIFITWYSGLAVRVSGYRYRGLGFDSRRYQIFWVVVGLERGPLSLVRSIEELLE